MEQLDVAAYQGGFERCAVGEGVALYGGGELTLLGMGPEGLAVMECSVAELAAKLGLYHVGDIAARVRRAAAPLQQAPVVRGAGVGEFAGLCCRGPLRVGGCGGYYYFGAARGGAAEGWGEESG